MRIGLIVIAFLFSFSGFSQQITQYSQWSLNQFSINPALAGLKRCLEVKSSIRGQWIGFEGAPVSGLLTINAPLPKQSKRFNDLFHGLGGKIEYDKFGPFNNFSANVAYAIHIPLGTSVGKHRLSFGIHAGIQQFGFNQSDVHTINPDPAVAESANKLLAPLLGFGAWYYSEYFYVGAAVDQLASIRWRDVGFASRFRIHTQIQAGTKYSFKEVHSLLPAVLFRIPPSGPVSFDLNLMYDYNNRFGVGIGYRNTDAFIMLFKVNIKQFTIGYSFDLITSSVKGGNFHTHELTIQFSGCRRDGPKATACPMFE